MRDHICICDKHDFYDFFPQGEQTPCPYCQIEELKAKLSRYENAEAHYVMCANKGRRWLEVPINPLCDSKSFTVLVLPEVE